MFSAEQGRWETDRAPYAREWMDSASTPWVREVAICASAQVGKTEAINNVVGFYVHQRPSPTIFVMPNREGSMKVADKRIVPMVKASKALRAELTGRAHDTKKRELVFQRSIVYFRSANSASDLASDSARVVVCDELDKWPQWAGRESSPLALVRKRTTTFPDHVVIKASTPTVRDGAIWQEFEDGDQRRYFVPCPHCGVRQLLAWANVKWPDDVSTAADMRRRREAWYECSACEKRIEDHHKREMVRDGVWVPDAWKDDVDGWLDHGRKADRESHRSYHIWAAYSPWVLFWQMAAEFLAARGEPAKLMDFYNSVLAEVWENRVASTTDAAVRACIDVERASLEVREEIQVLTAAVDVQKDRLEWALTGWLNDEQSEVLAVGIVPKSADRADWKQLGDVLFRNVYGPKKLPVQCCVIDSRYRRDEVLDFVMRHQPVAHMIAGVERDAPVPFGTVTIDKHPRTGLPLPHSVRVWTVNVALFKDVVAARIGRALSEPDTVAGRIGLPNDLTDSWLDQVTAEHKISVRVGARMKDVWVKKPGRDRNEAWDLLVYTAAAGRLIQVQRLRSDNAPEPPRAPQHRNRHRRPIAPTLGRR